MFKKYDKRTRNVNQKQNYNSALNLELRVKFSVNNPQTTTKSSKDFLTKSVHVNVYSNLISK